MDDYLVYIFLFLSVSAFPDVTVAVCSGSLTECACAKNCNCARQEYGLKATCSVRDSGLVLLSRDFSDPTHLKNLDLSGNNLSNIAAGVFGNFSSLQELSLARNRIQTLSYIIFQGLHQLRILNLSMNNLRAWTGSSTGQLTSLEIMDVHGNGDWTPDEQIFQLRRLKIIAGVSWSKHCLECTLEKRTESDADINELARGNYTSDTILCLTVEKRVSIFYQTMAKFEFLATNCHRFTTCTASEVGFYENHDRLCWLISQRLMVLHCTLGGVSILLNILVVIVFVTSRSLWKNVSMVLASNMAFSDFLTGVYGVLIASALLSYGDMNTLHRDRGDICPKVGVFWMLGQTGTIVTSLLLTLDRYITIEHSLKPDIRITPKKVKMALFLCWALALFVAVYPLFKGFYGLTPSCVPLTVRQGDDVKRYTLGVSVTAFCLYLSTLPMYARIYRVIKNSSQQMGIQRETVVLKKIALLVGTNFVFFFLPTACLGLITLFASKFKEGKEAEIQNLHFWLPSLSVGLNACVNPILYSYRNEKFRQELKEKFRCLHRESALQVRPPHAQLMLRSRTGRFPNHRVSDTAFTLQ